MSKTVSARLPRETHEELVNRCNKLGCTINDFLTESLKIGLHGTSDFEFGDESEEEKKPLKVLKVSKSETETPELKVTKVSYDGGKTWIPV